MKVLPLLTKEIHIRKFLKAHFPSIYRFITEKSYWLWIGIGINGLFISFFALLLLTVLPSWYRMQNTKEQFVSNALLWNNIGNTYQNYKDAYFQSALFAFEGNNLSFAQAEVEKTLFLDPTSSQAKTLKNIIGFEKKREAGK